MADYYGALRPFAMDLAAICDGPCGYLRWAWRLSTMSMAAICYEPCGCLQ